MSTRCQIAVGNEPVLIYKHSDGYPEGVLPTLEPFCQYFLAHRGWDSTYLLAQIVREFARVETRGRWVQSLTAPLEEDDSEFARKLRETMAESQRTLGWGLDTVIHSDIEYLYHVQEDRLVVIETGFKGLRRKPDGMFQGGKVIQKISLASARASG